MTTQNCCYPVLRIFLWLVSMMWLASASAQNQKTIDSLLSVLPHRYGAEKYTVYHWLAAEYADSDNEKAFEFAKRAEKIAYEVGDSFLIVKSQRLKGQLLFRLGRPQDVISLLEPLVHTLNLQKHDSEPLTILNLLGASHLIMSQFDKGLDFYFRTYEAAKQLGDKKYLATSLENIGVAYYKLKDYRKGLSYMLQSLTLSRELNNVADLSLMNVSLCYSYLGNFDSARKLLQESAEACGRNCPPRSMIHIKYASGVMKYQSQKFREAEREFQRSLQLSRELDDFRMQLDNIYLLAKICIRDNKLNVARQLLEEGDNIIRRGIPYNMEMIKVYGQLSELYSEMRQFKEASFYQSKYILLKDSIYNEALMTNLMNVESQYLEHENKAKIAAQKDDISSKEKIIRHQFAFNLLVGSLAIMSLAVLLLLFGLYTSKKQNSLLLEKKVNERTYELGLTLSKMERMIQEKDLQQIKVSQLISNTAKSLEGLCIAGSRDVSDDLSRTYLGKIQSTVKNLRKISG